MCVCLSVCVFARDRQRESVCVREERLNERSTQFDPRVRAVCMHVRRRVFVSYVRNRNTSTYT